jgi:predicted translin family RNA/ssDNA-binding protein
MMRIMLHLLLMIMKRERGVEHTYAVMENVYQRLTKSTYWKGILPAAVRKRFIAEWRKCFE